MSARPALTEIRVVPLPGDRRRGLVVAGNVAAPCALGRTGLTARKREGDGATPIGAFALLSVLYRPDRVARPATALPVEALRPDDGWCDDPADRRYNRPVRLPCPARHEKLWRDDSLYDVVVVLDFNLAPPMPGRGSAIFLHLARPGFAPTEGCVAIALAAMRRLLAQADPGTTLRIG
jgi:L,D-peptidoglycan transpeptidase YkuD (ErfK/YbiS/YcfS/YnhG family)